MLLLRSFCMKAGIQVLLREYNFENKQVQTFTGMTIGCANHFTIPPYRY
jgi:hypothetical protein